MYIGFTIGRRKLIRLSLAGWRDRGLRRLLSAKMWACDRKAVAVLKAVGSASRMERRWRVWKTSDRQGWAEFRIVAAGTRLLGASMLFLLRAASSMQRC